MFKLAGLVEACEGVKKEKSLGEVCEKDIIL